MRIRVSPGRERLAAMILGVVLGALFLGSAALWYAPVGSADSHLLPAGCACPHLLPPDSTRTQPP